MDELKMKEYVKEVSYNLAKMLTEHDLFISSNPCKPKAKEFIFVSRKDINGEENDDIPMISVPIRDINFATLEEKSERKANMGKDEMEESVEEICYDLAKMLLEYDLFISFDPRYEGFFVFASREYVSNCIIRSCVDDKENDDATVILVPIKEINIVISKNESEE